MYVAFFAAAATLFLVHRKHVASHLAAPKDDQSYSAQGKPEDLHGELIAFPGGGAAVNAMGERLMVLWDTEYTTW